MAVLIAPFTLASHRAFAVPNLRTRISSDQYHSCQSDKNYPYRTKSDYILKGRHLQAVDVAFFSQRYHHLNNNGHIDYLKLVHKVVKPTGRFVIIEKEKSIEASPLGVSLELDLRAGNYGLQTWLSSGLKDRGALFVYAESAHLTKP